MGGEGERGRGARVLEHHPGTREAIEVRSQTRGVSVGPEPVRAKSVDGDENHVRPRGSALLVGRAGDQAEKRKE